MLSAVRKGAVGDAAVNRTVISTEVFVVPHVRLEEVSRNRVNGLVSPGKGSGVVTLINKHSFIDQPTAIYANEKT